METSVICQFYRKTKKAPEIYGTRPVFLLPPRANPHSLHLTQHALSLLHCCPKSTIPNQSLSLPFLHANLVLFILSATYSPQKNIQNLLKLRCIFQKSLLGIPDYLIYFNCVKYKNLPTCLHFANYLKTMRKMRKLPYILL